MSQQEQAFPGVFCDACNKWRKPSGLMPDGSCPRCRSVIGEPLAASDDDADGGESQSIKIPWHFWVMVGATALYLGWRVIQGLQALF